MSDFGKGGLGGFEGAEERGKVGGERGDLVGCGDVGGERSFEGWEAS